MGVYAPGYSQPKQDQELLNFVGSGTFVSTVTGAIAANTTGIDTFTLLGAALGDQVTATSSVDPQGIVLAGAVSAPNTVKVYHSNVSAGGITVGVHNIILFVQRVTPGYQ